MAAVQFLRPSCPVTPAPVALNEPFVNETPVNDILPSISFTNPDTQAQLRTLTNAATGLGVAAITDLPHVPPFAHLRRLFDRLSEDAELAAKLNATYPLRGVYKDASLRNPEADQKLTVDLSRARVSRVPESLREKLGDDFVRVLSFFETFHDAVVPLLLEATSSIVGVDLDAVHGEENVNYRMCDYRPAQENTSAPRCGEHRDYGTFTVVFQDGNEGLEYLSRDGKWVAAGGAQVLVFWGWCAHVASAGKIRAAPHRVLKTARGVRRNTAVVFIAPDLKAPLTPLTAVGPARFGPRIMDRKVSVEEFKTIVGRKWRHREGNADDDGSVGNQDEAIQQFLLQ